MSDDPARGTPEPEWVKTPKEKYEQHMKECPQCSKQDPNEAVCEEGFKLLQEALKEVR